MTNPHAALALVAEGPQVTSEGLVAILLHGRTQTPAFMIEQIKMMGLYDLSCIAIPAAECSWYPGGFMEPLSINQPHLNNAMARINEVVEGLEKQGVSRSHIVLVGFSQGACLASEYLYRCAGRWAGLVAWTGGLIGPEGIDWPTQRRSLHGTPVFLSNSEADPWVPLGRTQETARVFREMGGQVTECFCPGRSHEVSDIERLHVSALLQSLGSKPASLSGALRCDYAQEERSPTQDF